MKKNALLSVAILTHNRCRYVLKTIESVFNQSYRPIEVVVVDSASSDGTVKAVKEAFPEVKIIKLHKNLGCPEGRNIALANCYGNIIFSLDDDAWIASSTFNICVERFQKEPNLGVIACRVISTQEENSDDMTEYYTHLFSGGSCAIKKEVLENAGYFPSDFFRQAEESDLALRIIEAGYSLVHSPDAIVYHERIPINAYDNAFLFYSCRNEIYTVIRRYPLFLIPPALLWKILLWNWAGVKKMALHLTLGGSIAAALKVPQLLLQRDPVSFKTIRRFLTLSKKPDKGKTVA